MKKKVVLPIVAVVAVVLMLFVTPVQNLAVDAMSLFRVGEVKTVEIAMSDIEELMGNLEEMQSSYESKELVIPEGFTHGKMVEVISYEYAEPTELASAEEFTEFEFTLPSEFDDQTPKIYASNLSSVTFKLNVDEINKMLELFGHPAVFPVSANGVEMTLNIPASATAYYEDTVLMATQKPVLEAPVEVKEDLKEMIVSSPLLPTNVAAQLAEIPVDSSDVYLPVLVGIGREVDLGQEVGYVYSVKDVKSFAETASAELPADMTSEQEHGEDTGMSASLTPLIEYHKAMLAPEELQQLEAKHAEAKAKHDEMLANEEQIKAEMPNMENASVLVWTQDGVIYAVAGDMTDEELAEVARSVH